MKALLMWIVAVMIVVTVGYGSWQLDRKFKYKFGYQSQVQAELQPLVERINALEIRVKQLENKR
jgi:cytochrome oxidase assembly protein ShyY1